MVVPVIFSVPLLDDPSQVIAGRAVVTTRFTRTIPSDMGAHLRGMKDFGPRTMAIGPLLSDMVAATAPAAVEAVGRTGDRSDDPHVGILVTSRGSTVMILMRPL